MGSLRCRKLYKAMRDATITAALREWLRIVHISLQRTHVHLLVEAEHKAALSRGMQGFLISAARHIHTALGDRARRRRGMEVRASWSSRSAGDASIALGTARWIAEIIEMTGSDPALRCT